MTIQVYRIYIPFFSKLCWRLGAELPYISHHGIALILMAAAMTDGVANNGALVYQVTVGV